ncbi:hypothetical protein J2S01_002749 [Pectinatus haikarae]|uniref:Uncharacterized protein n=1 Tax=Pectinatus haikarae TaxID=349096 RepID=A0ABT9YB13_9FIRM|nr:hypothetical protein [Pectinatus haikarae]
MDILMVGILVICFFLIKIFADWCEQQVSKL